MSDFAQAFRELSVHFGGIQTRLHEEVARLAANASDEPVTKSEIGEAFLRIAEPVAVYQTALFNVAQRMSQIEDLQAAAASQAETSSVTAPPRL